MKKFFNKIISFNERNDIKFIIYEKFSKQIGLISILINKFIYRSKLEIIPPYNIWGSIRILIHGKGKIKIDKNFHAISDRKRSAITLFSPVNLNVLGSGKIILHEHVGLNGTTIVSKNKIEIGKDTIVGPNTIIIDHDGHNIWPPDTRYETKGKSSPIIISKNVWIGMNCTILKGVQIGEGSVIAAGSVVVKDCEKNTLYAGNPAKKIRKIDND